MSLEFSRLRFETWVRHGNRRIGWVVCEVEAAGSSLAPDGAACIHAWRMGDGYAVTVPGPHATIDDAADALRRDYARRLEEADRMATLEADTLPPPAGDDAHG
jgi:hypothetical protein